MPKQTKKISVSLNRDTLPLAVHREKERAKKLGYRYSLSAYLVRLIKNDLEKDKGN